MRDGSRGQSIARSVRDKLTARDEGKRKHSKVKLLNWRLNSSCVIAFLFLVTHQFYKPLILQGKI